MAIVRIDNKGSVGAYTARRTQEITKLEARRVK